MAALFTAEDAEARRGSRWIAPLSSAFLPVLRGESYQWRKDGTNIAGATNSTLTLRDVTIASTGEYDVEVTNPAGTVLSDKATLRVSFADIKRYSGVTLRGNIGDKFLIEFQDDLDQSDVWTTATNITLAAPEFIWIDFESAEKANRFYRATYQRP